MYYTDGYYTQRYNISIKYQRKSTAFVKSLTKSKLDRIEDPGLSYWCKLKACFRIYWNNK